MSQPILHLMNHRGYLCKKPISEERWEQKYLNDEVARQLEICPPCIENYVRRHGQKKWDKIITRVKGTHWLGDGYCPCGHHPEQQEMRSIGVYEESYSEDESMEFEDSTLPSREGLKTLRMYLNT